MHQFGWLSERGGNFFDLPQKEGVPRKWGSLRKGGVPTLEEAMYGCFHKYNREGCFILTVLGRF